MRRRWYALILIGFVIISVFSVIFVINWSNLVSPLPHELVCQLTGEEALNDTTVVNVYGADVGLFVYHQDRMQLVFGDTFGPDKWDWRSNTIAYTDDTDPSDGILLTGWITDDATHLAKELIHSLKVDNIEMTAIPTTAVSSDEVLYIYYMSVRHWGDAGDWTCNNASIAYSLDGENFIKASNMTWPGNSNFIEWGLIKGDDTAPSTGGYLYFLTTGSGRYQFGFLARVPDNQILDQSSYEYFSGLGLGGLPQWTSNHENAEPVIEAPMGEISVMWNSYLGKYMLMNLDDVEHRIVIRTANTPWGPWGHAFTVIIRPEYSGFYAPNIDPRMVEDNGRIVYFTMSLWIEYNVYLMKVDVTRLIGLASLPYPSIVVLTWTWLVLYASEVKLRQLQKLV